MPAVPRRLSILPRKFTFRVHKNGLAGTRTQGLCLAKAAIFQLIYKPERDKRSKWISGLRICSVYRHLGDIVLCLGGDPAADSPTATLLRLNPPCKAQVRTRHEVRALTHTSLGWFDGRCVQGAGTYSPRYIETRLLRIPASRGRVTALDPNYEWVCEITSPFQGRDPLSHPL